jgi:hypothetical protein
MKAKTPKLTPQQKAQVLGETRASANPLEEMDLRVFLRIARKMYCRDYPSGPALMFKVAKCSQCNRANVLIGLSRALDLLAGDLQTLNHQIKPVIFAAKLLLKASRTTARKQSNRQ